MFYFVEHFLKSGQFYFYALLISTIVLFFFGKTSLGQKYEAHTYFHITIGILAGAIPLFS
jgi:uncharacterized membrane protein YkvI